MNSFNRLEVSKDLKHLRQAIINEEINVVNSIHENYRQFLESSLPGRSFSECKVDTFSSYLIPDDIPHDLTPVKTTSNGDCFYNSASILLTGNESLSHILRVMIAAEIFLNNEFYVKHPRYTFFV